MPELRRHELAPARFRPRCLVAYPPRPFGRCVSSATSQPPDMSGGYCASSWYAVHPLKTIVRNAQTEDTHIAMTTADSLSDTVDGKWLTHAELAEARGISKASAARLVRRTKWRRQADNHGRVRILVPFDAISEAENRPDDRKDDLVEVADGRTDTARGAADFEDA